MGWEDLCISLRHVTLPYHPLEIVELGVEHWGGRPRGGIGVAAHFESPEARLNHWVVNGLNGSNPSETELLTPFLATSWPLAYVSLYTSSTLHRHTCAAVGVSDPFLASSF